MKKTIALVGIVVMMLVLLISGCTEDNNGGTTGQTYTWTAKEMQDDVSIDSDWETYIKILYTSLGDGDTLIIQDTISEVTYDSLTDRTTITFDTSEGGDMTSSVNLPFEGNLTAC